METEKGRELSIDELLSQQTTPDFLATVEAVPDDNDNVKVTPWSSGGGCQCHSAVTIPKKSIKSVVLTGEKHFCCDHSLSVVEIRFQGDATIDLSKLFQQLIARSRKTHAPVEHGEHRHEAVPHRPSGRFASATGSSSTCRRRCSDGYLDCEETCASWPDPEQCFCLCRNALCGCLRGCGGAGCQMRIC